MVNPIRIDVSRALEGGVDYRELLCSKGIVILVTDADDDSMDGAVDDDDADDDGSMGEEAIDDDVHMGTPLQCSSIGGVDPQSREGAVSQGNSQALTHGQSSQSPSKGVMVKSQEEPQEDPCACARCNTTKSGAQ